MNRISEVQPLDQKYNKKNFALREPGKRRARCVSLRSSARPCNPLSRGPDDEAFSLPRRTRAHSGEECFAGWARARARSAASLLVRVSSSTHPSVGPVGRSVNPVHPSIRLSIRRSICRSIRLSIHLPIYGMKCVLARPLPHPR